MSITTGFGESGTYLEAVIEADARFRAWLHEKKNGWPSHVDKRILDNLPEGTPPEQLWPEGDRRRNVIYKRKNVLPT
jgi:hypothetical protein